MFSLWYAERALVSSVCSEHQREVNSGGMKNQLKKKPAQTRKYVFFLRPKTRIVETQISPKHPKLI